MSMQRSFNCVPFETYHMNKHSLRNSRKFQALRVLTMQNLHIPVKNQTKKHPLAE